MKSRYPGGCGLFGKEGYLHSRRNHCNTSSQIWSESPLSAILNQSIPQVFWKQTCWPLGEQEHALHKNCMAHVFRTHSKSFGFFPTIIFKWDHLFTLKETMKKNDLNLNSKKNLPRISNLDLRTLHLSTTNSAISDPRNEPFKTHLSYPDAQCMSYFYLHLGSFGG